MQPITIARASITLKAPEGRDDIYDLSARRDATDRFFTSAWMPTREEIALINAGQPVYLHVMGAVHPPIAIDVPEKGAE